MKDTDTLSLCLNKGKDFTAPSEGDSSDCDPDQQSVSKQKMVTKTGRCPADALTAYQECLSHCTPT